MITSKDELFELYGNFASQVYGDVQHFVEELMDKENLTENDIANLFDTSEDEIIDIINGEFNNVTLATFLLILIASGLTMDIVPIEPPMQGRNGRRVPPRSFDDFSFHNDDDDDDDDYDADEKIDEIDDKEDDLEDYDYRSDITSTNKKPDLNDMPHWTKQGRDPKTGRFLSKKNEDNAENTPKYEHMIKDDLCNIIREHLWDSEIDLENASRTELIAFLNDKDVLRKNRKEKKENKSNVNAENDYTRKLQDLFVKSDDDDLKQAIRKLVKNIFNE